MIARTVAWSLLVVMLAAGGLSNAAQEKKDKKQSGTVIGELKSLKNTPNGKNTNIEVLAPGEEKARTYRVQYDAKVGGPMPAVLAAVRAAKVGDRVEFDWVNTGEGLAITSFKVLKKDNK